MICFHVLPSVNCGSISPPGMGSFGEQMHRCHSRSTTGGIGGRGASGSPRGPGNTYSGI